MKKVRFCFLLLSAAVTKTATSIENIQEQSDSLKDDWKSPYGDGGTELWLQMNSTPHVAWLGLMESGRNSQGIPEARQEDLDDRIYSSIASCLLLLMFVNLGTVLDLERIRSIMLKPIGPVIGFFTSYFLMPGLALALGFLCFRQNKPLQLALFFTALSPSGGLANICTIFLKGNINLSVASTTINALSALGMFPFWILLLAHVIFDDSNLDVPFVDLAVGSISLVIAISVGVILRVLIPQTTRFVFRYLKPLSMVLSLCLIGVTVGINAFAFKEITLMISTAAILLPLLGYVISFFISKLLRRSYTDSLTIAIETSVLNMTVPIVLLRYTLDEPESEMGIIMPIMAALMSLILIVIFYVVRRIFGGNKQVDPDAFNSKQFLVPSSTVENTNSLSENSTTVVRVAKISDNGCPNPATDIIHF